MQDIYTSLIRPLLFAIPGAGPEWLHQQTLRSLAWMTRPGPNEATANQPRSIKLLQQAYTLADPPTRK
ncbi:MAG: hypothetical protein HC886_23250, partial [Leptolyngbyaceae cyanobacterium SM1_1_3]|nr:hypothetical protein [Leptolyngbyaceae cyanobacterium SM1_1_3]